MTIDDADGRRLTRYIAGECSLEEADEVRTWIATDPALAQLVDDLTQVWRAGARSTPRGADVETAWRDFVTAREARRVRPLRVGPPAQDQRVDRRRRWPFRPAWWTQVAAAAVVVIVGGALWYRVLGGASDRPRRASAMAAMDSGRVYATRRGERAEFRLPDGSRVVLGVDSRISVPANFGATVRAVQLSGEAYFEVTHDAARPFLVYANGTVTQDLGTIFGLRAYSGDRVRVVVAEGAVAVRDTLARTAAKLDARSFAVVEANGHVTVQRNIDPDVYLAWVTGRLVFQDASFAEVARELERRFDVHVVVADSSLLTASVNATFEDDGLDAVLNLLARTLDVRIERQSDRIIVRRHD